MPDLSKKDKLEILERLAKRVDDWRLQKNLPRLRLIALGNSTLSQNSPEFTQWLEKVNEGIEVVFGEYSHYLAEFKDIHYADILTAFAVLAGDKEASETYFWSALDRAQDMIRLMIEEVKGQREDTVAVPGIARSRDLEQKRRVFIGHGRSLLWARVKLYLQDDLGLETVCYESESRTGKSIVPALEEMLERAGFAVLILTAEDETASGLVRARQNVIHEVGLFQSRLGFERVVLLKEEGVEDFTNIAGLQCIPFSDNKIEQTFYELGKTLKREKLI